MPVDEDIEPDSNGEVLKNKLGIKAKAEMDILEKDFLQEAENQLLHIEKNHQFSSQDICDIHELWLGDIYSFAGKYRTVTLQKSDFLFAAPNLISKLMLELETKYLEVFTPCNFSNDDALANAIGIVHAELILIHPFREGNGRAARLLADLMAMQANRPPINYGYISQLGEHGGFDEYISAIHAALDREYSAITRIFKILLGNSS